MAEKVSNKCKIEEGEQTKKDEIAETGDAEGSLNSESEIRGWG